MYKKYKYKPPTCSHFSQFPVINKKEKSHHYHGKKFKSFEKYFEK